MRALFETSRGGFGAARWPPGARVGVSPDQWALGGRQRPGALQSQKGSETETRPARSPDSFATGASAAVESGRSDPHLELGSELELFSDFRSLSGDGLRAPNFIQIEGHAGVFHTGNSGYG